MIYQNERPMTFDEMKGQETTVENIRNQSIRNSWFQVFILEGQFGSGKTTMSGIIARAVNCENKDSNGNPCLKCKNCLHIQNDGMDFIEIDGADHNGVDDIRKVKEMAGYLPMELKYKVVIIDEVQKLSAGAFNCLLKLLEEPPSYMIFILCTTEVESIPKTVRSRSACYTFNRIPHDTMVAHIIDVAHRYGLTITESAASLLADNSDGAMRNALVFLEMSAACGINIDEKICKDLLGICAEEELCSIFTSFLERDLTTIISNLDQLERTGKSFAFLAAKMVQGCADLIMAHCFSADVIGGTMLYKDYIAKLAMKYPLCDFCSMASALKDLPAKLRAGGGKYEFIVYIVAAFKEIKDNDLQERVERLEKNISGCTMQNNNISFFPEPEAVVPVKPQEAESAAVYIVNADKSIVPINESQVEEEIVEDNDAAFLDSLDYDNFYSELNTQSYSVAGKEPHRETKPVSPTSLLEQFETCLSEDQELYSTYKNRCTVGEQDGEILIATPDLAVNSKLLMFVVSKGITNVRVCHKNDDGVIG